MDLGLSVLSTLVCNLLFFYYELNMEENEPAITIDLPIINDNLPILNDK